MSTKMPTLEDMLNPDKNVQPVQQEVPNKEESPKKPQEDKTKDKDSSGKKIKKKKTKKKEEKKEEPKKEEEKKEDKVEEPKKEEPKEEKKEEPKKEEPKKEEPKKEEPKKEEAKKEEPKEKPKKEEEKKEEPKEEEKKEEPKVEEEKKEEKKEPKKPREPEPKIPSDFSELINEINNMKKEGNEKYKNGQIEEALLKYKEAHEKLEKELPKIDKERDYNPQSSELFTLFIQLSQNLSLCYFKTEKFEESIKLDQQIIARDNNYDKAYFRLFKSYLKLGKKAQAVYFGNHLLGFDEETKKRYEEIIPEIEQAKKSLQEEYDAIRAKERKEMMKSIAKYAVPILVLIAAVCIYFFVFKKKKLPK